MQKNLYFRVVLRRHNIIVESLLNLFLAFASYPRLLLEVFIRKNFGDRYFSLASVLTIVGINVFVPYFFLQRDSYFSEKVSFWTLVERSPSAFIFLAAFLAAGIWHHFQVRKGPSVFDFEKLSLSSGDIHPLFFKIRLFGKRPSVRLVETVYEPLFFFIIGFILVKLKIAVGSTIIAASIFYSLGYIGAYKQGDDFVKDKIDEMIMNQHMEHAFVNDEDNNEFGVRIRAEKPTSRDMRSSLAREFVVEDDRGAEAT